MAGRRTVLIGALGTATALVAAACGNDGKTTGLLGRPGAKPAEGTTDGSQAEGASGAPEVTVSPAAGAAEVAVTVPIVVTAQGGKLQTVTVNGGGKSVAGRLEPDGKTWKSTGALGYGTAYTVAATIVDAKGASTEKSTTFTTVKPAGVAGVTFQANAMAALKTGGTYGIGQVVSVAFGKPVKDRAAAEKAMTVTADPPVEGKWKWVEKQIAHWRPAEYWKPGTKVTVQVTAFGVHLGDNIYGGANATTNFTIGPARVAIADSNSHYMQVFVDGQQVKNMPISMGKGGETKGSKGETIDFWTRSGVHVIMEKAQTVNMTSASFGISNPKDPNFYDEHITFCCRISQSGEYVHLADWNIPAHGKQNTSHGCINVGPDNAKWFYANFGVGDVVEVRNTPKQLPLTDGLGDWNVPYGQW